MTFFILFFLLDHDNTARSHTLSVWTIETINPIETFNLCPADKKPRESTKGMKEEGSFLFIDGLVPETADRPLVLKKKTFVSTALAVLVNAFLKGVGD